MHYGFPDGLQVVIENGLLTSLFDGSLTCLLGEIIEPRPLDVSVDFKFLPLGKNLFYPHTFRSKSLERSGLVRLDLTSNAFSRRIEIYDGHEEPGLIRVYFSKLSHPLTWSIPVLNSTDNVLSLPDGTIISVYATTLIEGKLEPIPPKQSDNRLSFSITSNTILDIEILESPQSTQNILIIAGQFEIAAVTCSFFPGNKYRPMLFSPETMPNDAAQGQMEFIRGYLTEHRPNKLIFAGVDPEIEQRIIESFDPQRMQITSYLTLDDLYAHPPQAIAGEPLTCPRRYLPLGLLLALRLGVPLKIDESAPKPLLDENSKTAVVYDRPGLGGIVAANYAHFRQANLIFIDSYIDDEYTKARQVGLELQQKLLILGDVLTEIATVCEGLGEATNGNPLLEKASALVGKYSIEPLPLEEILGLEKNSELDSLASSLRKLRHLDDEKMAAAEQTEREVVSLREQLSSLVTKYSGHIQSSAQAFNFFTDGILYGLDLDLPHAYMPTSVCDRLALSDISNETRRASLPSIELSIGPFIRTESHTGKSGACSLGMGLIQAELIASRDRAKEYLEKYPYTIVTFESKIVAQQLVAQYFRLTKDGKSIQLHTVSDPVKGQLLEVDGEGKSWIGIQRDPDGRMVSFVPNDGVTLELMQVRPVKSQLNKTGLLFLDGLLCAEDFGQIHLRENSTVVVGGPIEWLAYTEALIRSGAANIVGGLGPTTVQMRWILAILSESPNIRPAEAIATIHRKLTDTLFIPILVGSTFTQLKRSFINNWTTSEYLKVIHRLHEQRIGLIDRYGTGYATSTGLLESLNQGLEKICQQFETIDLRLANPIKQILDAELVRMVGSSEDDRRQSRSLYEGAYQQLTRTSQETPDNSLIALRNDIALTLGTLCYDLGDLSAAKEWFDLSVQDAHQWSTCQEAYVLLQRALTSISVAEKDLQKSMAMFLEAYDYFGVAYSGYRLGRFYLDSGRPHDALHLLQASQSMFVQLKNEYMQGKSSEKVAKAHLLLGETGSALENFDFAISHFKSARHPKGIIRAMVERGEILALQERYTEAESAIEDAIKIASQLDQPRPRLIARKTMSKFLYDQHRFLEAIEQWKECAVLAENLGNLSEAANSYRMIGLSYSAQGNNYQALEYFDLGTRYAIDASDLSQQAQNRNNQGIAAYFLKNYEGALSYFDESLDCFQKIDDKTSASRIINNIGLVHWARGEYDQAHECFLQASNQGVFSAKGNLVSTIPLTDEQRELELSKIQEIAKNGGLENELLAVLGNQAIASGWNGDYKTAIKTLPELASKARTSDRFDLAYRLEVALAEFLMSEKLVQDAAGSLVRALNDAGNAGLPVISKVLSKYVEQVRILPSEEQYVMLKEFIEGFNIEEGIPWPKTDHDEALVIPILACLVYLDALMVQRGLQAPASKIGQVLLTRSIATKHQALILWVQREIAMQRFNEKKYAEGFDLFKKMLDEAQVEGELKVVSITCHQIFDFVCTHLDAVPEEADVVISELLKFWSIMKFQGTLPAEVIPLEMLVRTLQGDLARLGQLHIQFNQISPSFLRPLDYFLHKWQASSLTLQVAVGTPSSNKSVDSNIPSIQRNFSLLEIIKLDVQGQVDDTTNTFVPGSPITIVVEYFNHCLNLAQATISLDARDDQGNEIPELKTPTPQFLKNLGQRTGSVKWPDWKLPIKPGVYELRVNIGAIYGFELQF